VRIFPVSGPPKAGAEQTVLVEVEPRGSIPLHSHTVDAEMIIVAGNGWVCATDATNGRHVSPGYRVFYEADKPHGFRAGDDGLSFISVNGGIVDELADRWDFEPAQV
jgi:quercetin dioxygenase-like cupin family protein